MQGLEHDELSERQHEALKFASSRREEQRWVELGQGVTIWIRLENRQDSPYMSVTTERPTLRLGPFSCI